MVYANNFRYGEISRRNAGRFDSDFYRNGCFEFRNMVTDFTGSASRRPPIRKLIDTDAELLIEFSISEILAYTIGISPERIRIYRYVLDEYTEVVNSAYPDQRVLTSKQIKELRWAQYYTRMYFVHPDFRPFFMDFDAVTEDVTLSNMTIVINQDAKKKYWFTPSYVEDENGNEIPALEGRVLYQKTEDGVVSWYLDEEFTEQYEYSASYPPINGEASYISGYDDYEDDDLLTGEGNYPSGISIINDSIYLFATNNNPQTFWKSRVIGSSQWIDGWSADTMHDFVQFQAVHTESVELVEEEELPMKELTDVYGNVYYEQQNGNDIWYQPDKDSEGNYIYQRRVYKYYEDEDINTDNFIWVYDLNDPDNTHYDKETYGEPIQKPIMVYDFSDTSKLLRTVVAIDYVTTDSCATRTELNTGRMDKINDIVAGCGYIFVLTSNAEFRLPSNFSAVNNLRVVDGNSSYTTYGSQSIRAVNLNSSVMFLQKSGILREYYLYQGYMANGDTTMLNHDILSSGVFQAVVKNTPDPRVFFIMENGSCVTLTYDKENSIQSFSPWDMKGRKFISGAKLSGPLKDEMLFLIKSDTESWIGYLDEAETEDFSDEGEAGYISYIKTAYTEVINQNLVFGRYKKAHTAWIRPYNTGHIETGNDEDNLSVSKNELGSEDWSTALTGVSRRQSSFIVKAHESDPMTILCYAYEVS